jgi:hypothetical protein
VTVSLRRLWPKYDQDLNQYIDNPNLIEKAIQHSFEQANLSADFENLSIGANIWQFIDDEGLTSLNQLQIINVIKRFYGDTSAYVPGRKKSPVKQRPKTAVEPSAGGSYAELYARVKEVANDKKWP